MKALKKSLAKGSFPHKRAHKNTWVLPNHSTKNKVDQLCMSRETGKNLPAAVLIRGTDVSSDHHLFVGKLSLKLQR